MKKRRHQRHLKAKRAATKDAWAAAAAYGCDMNLLEASLARSPQERIDVHENALALVEALQAAGRRLYGKP